MPLHKRFLIPGRKIQLRSSNIIIRRQFLYLHTHAHIIKYPLHPSLNQSVRIMYNKKRPQTILKIWSLLFLARWIQSTVSWTVFCTPASVCLFLFLYTRLFPCFSFPLCRFWPLHPFDLPLHFSSPHTLFLCSISPYHDIYFSLVSILYTVLSILFPQFSFPFLMFRLLPSDDCPSHGVGTTYCAHSASPFLQWPALIRTLL